MNIIESIKKHNNQEKISFHMPGHKLGNALKKTALESEIWKYDTTELSDTDCLQNPKDFLKCAEEKTAKVYGAMKSFYLVNGSTCGVLSMFFACFKEGDKVIISRDCHKSVINAAIITGIKPIYIEPKKNSCNIYGCVEVEEIEKAFTANTDCKGVFITSPTYYGLMCDVKAIAEVVHKYGALLLCDEAHGAHFPFSERFPESATSLGADMSVVSFHKTLPAPNQTAVLNLGNCRIESSVVQTAVNMFQTTSPSYVLLASIEEALDIGIRDGKELTDKVLNLIPKSKYIKTFDDPFKIILDFTEKGFEGKFVSDILENKFGIFSEMTQELYVLLMISWGNVEGDFSCLEKAINYIDSLPDNQSNNKRKPRDVLFFDGVSQLTPREVVMRERIAVDIDLSEGRIAAREVTSFPPCIPYFMPGEKITKEHIDLIKYALENNVLLTGVDNRRIEVVKDTE